MRGEWPLGHRSMRCRRNHDVIRDCRRPVQRAQTDEETERPHRTLSANRHGVAIPRDLAHFASDGLKGFGTILSSPKPRSRSFIFAGHLIHCDRRTGHGEKGGKDRNKETAPH